MGKNNNTGKGNGPAVGGQKGQAAVKKEKAPIVQTPSDDDEMQENSFNQSDSDDNMNDEALRRAIQRGDHEHDDDDDDDSYGDFMRGYDDEPEEEVEFWAVNLAANSKHDESVEIGESLELHHAALAPGSKGDTTLSVTIGNEEFVLCTLSPQCPQFRLKLGFSDNEGLVKFGTSGSGKMTLVGSRRMLISQDDIDLDDDEEIPSDEEEELEEKLPQLPKKAANQEPKQENQPKKQEKAANQQPKQENQPKKQENQPKKQEKAANQQPKQENGGQQQQGQQKPKGQQTPGKQQGTPGKGQQTPGKAADATTPGKRPSTSGGDQQPQKKQKTGGKIPIE